MSLASYISARTQRTERGCVEWIGLRTKGGYGTCNFNGLKTTAHRASFIRSGKSIPDGMELDHLCKNTICVNPDHLEVVSHRENVRRCDKAVATQCKNGHAFTVENTYVKSNGCRSCRTCNLERQRILRANNLERYRDYDRKRIRK